MVVDGTSARLQDGTLAGSILTLNRAIANVHQHTNKPLWEIVNAATLNPARAMGMQDRIGSIRPGCCADFAVFDDSFHTRMTLSMAESFIARTKIFFSVTVGVRGKRQMPFSRTFFPCSSFLSARRIQ